MSRVGSKVKHTFAFLVQSVQCTCAILDSFSNGLHVQFLGVILVKLYLYPSKVSRVNLSASLNHIVYNCSKQNIHLRLIEEEIFSLFLYHMKLLKF